MKKNIKKPLNVDELWNRYHKGRENREGNLFKNRLIENHHPLVKFIAEKIHAKLPPNIELDDLMQEGIFGLIDAIEKYNGSVKFETYAYSRIRGSILDYLRDEDWVPDIIRSAEHQLEKGKNKLGDRITREQLIKELSKKKYACYHPNTWDIKGRKKALKIIEDNKNLKKLVHFQDLDNYKEDDGYAREGDFLEDKKVPNPFDNTQRKDLQEFLEKGLTKTEKLLLRLYYSNYHRRYKSKKKYYSKGMPMLDIGKVIGLSEPSVSLKHRLILKTLKTKLTIRELTFEDCLNDL